ncbi:MAG: 3-oxoacyl-ACP reductase FabG [Ferruginibacter sp.]|nr:3-oxoacyl-ACP reductase FabG [Cytophagales bacterium]
MPRCPHSFSHACTTGNRLQDKVAIITGRARGIGQATAEVFTREGARVVLWDVLEAGAETARTLREKGLPTEFHHVSTTDFDALSEAAAHVHQHYGRIDILVNNAGITRDASLLKMTPEQWHHVLDVNLTGVFNCTRVVAPYMKARGFGRILSASSIVGLYGNFGQTNYAATKAGVIAMTKVWARELGKYGITANAAAPGFIQTEMTNAIPETVKAQAIAHIPGQRMGLPEDIAHAYLFLASEEAGFVNGHCLSVDSGAVG